MLNKELFNYFPIDSFSEKLHHALRVGLMEQPNLSFPLLIVHSFSQATKNDLGFIRGARPNFARPYFPVPFFLISLN